MGAGKQGLFPLLHFHSRLSTGSQKRSDNGRMWTVCTCYVDKTTEVILILSFPSSSLPLTLLPPPVRESMRERGTGIPKHCAPSLRCHRTQSMFKLPLGYRSQFLPNGLHSYDGHTFQKATSWTLSLSCMHALTHSCTLSRSGNSDQPLSWAGSRQVVHRKEHDHTGEQHAADHEVLVLESPLLDEPHHRVGQAQHVGNV